MATTVAQLLAQIQTMVMEDATFSSGLWSITEIIGYINQASDQFMLQAQVSKQSNDINPVAGTRQYADPANSMQLDRLAFQNIPLYRSNVHQLDLSNRNWRTLPGTPRSYHQDHLANKQFELDRAPTAALVAAAAKINVISTIHPPAVAVAGDNLQVPDFAVYVVKFGVLQRMFAKEGEAQDVARAKYCEERFGFGCGLLSKFLGTETDTPLPEVAKIG